MTTHTIDNVRNTTLHADIAGDTWIITKTGEITTPSTGIDASNGAANREIIVNGSVYGLNYGIEFGNMAGKGGGELVIGNSGTVSSDDTAIFTHGDGQITTNNGTIGGMEGIYSSGDQSLITNNGLIKASNGGIVIENGTATIVNTGKIVSEGAIWAPSYDNGGSAKVIVENSGRIIGDKVSIELVSVGDHEIHNMGKIVGEIIGGDGNDRLENTGKGVLKNEASLGDGNDRFINSGKTLDDVYLDDGNDIADLRGGTLTGTLYGGAGDDVFFFSNNDLNIHENAGEGVDTIKSTVSVSLALDRYGEMENVVLLGKRDSNIDGNELDNRIIGNAGDNYINGGEGGDMLRGGAGADVFVFEGSSQQDEIRDFQNGIDRIDLSDWLDIDNYQDVKDLMIVSGDDVVIDAGMDRITLHDTKMSEIDKSDFIFA
ncbi:MAG: hemolysin-type calcium-binding repeat family protein [Rhizobium sp.]|nr:hemolysin-type calcium-binding repeat family protein [Rhizobium sp.]